MSGVAIFELETATLSMNLFSFIVVTQIIVPQSETLNLQNQKVVLFVQR